MLSVKTVLQIMRQPNQKNELVPCSFTYVKEDGSLVEEINARVLLKPKAVSEAEDLYVPYQKADGEIRRFFTKSLIHFNGQSVFI